MQTSRHGTHAVIWLVYHEASVPYTLHDVTRGHLTTCSHKTVFGIPTYLPVNLHGGDITNKYTHGWKFQKFLICIPSIYIWFFQLLMHAVSGKYVRNLLFLYLYILIAWSFSSFSMVQTNYNFFSYHTIPNLTLFHGKWEVYNLVLSWEKLFHKILLHSKP